MLEGTTALLAGLLIGSFLNVCIYRLPRDLSVVSPRSYCPSCKAPISWRDNIPLVSYALLRGRCRHCGAHIPLRYPVVELLTGVGFLAAFLLAGASLAAVKLSLFIALEVALAFSDLEERILPDEFTLGGTAAGLVFAAVLPMQRGYVQLLAAARWDPRWISVAESAAGAAVGAGLLWLVGAAYNVVRHREGLGLGDVKMMAMLGSFLGLHGALQSLILGAVAGSILGLLYIWLSKKDFSNYELPFGTFLALAGVAVAFLQLAAGG